MIGAGLKKLAREHGMSIDKGVAYGSFGGFCTTMCEGSGYKQISFVTSIADPTKERAFTAKVDERNIQKEFRVSRLSVTRKYIQVTFDDRVGTMGRIREFLNWFLPLLEEADAARCLVCPQCGGEITGGCWKLIGGVAYYMHNACGDAVERQILGEEQKLKEEATGSYATGLMGALIGAALGGVLWAVVMYFGYIASFVGLAIGWLAEFGYNLLKGKQAKGKIAVLILAVIFGVLLGNFGADAITVAQLIGAGELPGMTYGEIPWLIAWMLESDPEYRAATIRYLLGGLFFAGLGVWGLLRRANAEVSTAKIVDLK